MKPILQSLGLDISTLLTVQRYSQPNFDIPLHFHPEYELTYISAGSGNRFVGDHIEKFDAGDLVFIGSGVPHVWRNERKYYQGDTSLTVSALVLQFREDLFATQLADSSIFSDLFHLLEKSRHGVLIGDRLKPNVIQRMEELEGLEGIYRYTKLIELLDMVEQVKDYVLLNTVGQSLQQNDALVDRRVDEVVNYIVEHYTNDLSLAEVARFARMNLSSFCRFFKNKTGRTFSQYVSELRINYACKLLMDESLSISQACFESGFNNLSYFNRQFKHVKGMTPRAYRESIRF